MVENITQQIEPLKRSPCPVANALDLFGDKWSLLIIRDILFGKHQYNAFSESPENIPTNILANRLKRLEQAGIIYKKPYQDRPVRYEYHLTPKGYDLYPALKEISLWGNKYIPGTRQPSFKEIESLLSKISPKEND